MKFTIICVPVRFKASVFQKNSRISIFASGCKTCDFGAGAYQITHFVMKQTTKNKQKKRLF